ncbi:MAG: DUF1566 domain-containing protein [Algibacter sp.]
MKKRSLKTMKIVFINLVIGTLLLSSCDDDDNTSTIEPNDNLPDITGFPIVGTNQTTFFDLETATSTQSEGDDFYGQNANYLGNIPNYEDNGDGTVTDMVTGLMWQNSFDHNGDGNIDYFDKLTYDEILETVDTVTTGGHTDWRLPTIKEQYSLIMFSGRDISSYQGTSTEGLTPFINTDYFEFNYGDLDNHERLIDVQCATTNVYVSTEVENMVFGVNLADGRIKGYGYGIQETGGDKSFNYLLVRGNDTYGENNFIDNGDGTVSDTATDLMWMQNDNAEAILWPDALVYAENKEYAGYSDWRLPDVKELQSILDYTRSPATTNSAAIDPLLNCTQILNEGGDTDYPWYWSNTTHVTSADEREGGWAAYVAFGRCMGNMGTDTWSDVHGAGAQRSDPKGGDPDEFSEGHGPQGDAIRIYNYVRLVRNTN